MSDLPSAVLFCCTLNSIRSPMAEGIMKSLHRGIVFADSVGVRPEDVDPFAVEVMAEIGVDLSKHRSKSFQMLDDTSFDFVISLSPEAQHSAVELTRWMACEVEYWPTFDPSVIEGARTVRLDAYRHVRDELVAKISARFPPAALQKTETKSGT
jgi:protein-tyrosine-phosphatase